MKKLSFILIALLLPLLAVAETVEMGYLAYELNDDGTANVVRSRYSLEDINVEIPSVMSYDGKEYSVTSLDDGAFSVKLMPTVTIPEGVTRIGGSCFLDCGRLTSVTLPSTLTSIGEYAFWGDTVLTSIVVPEGIKVLEENTFSACYRLEDVTLPSTLTSLGDKCFNWDYRIKTLTCYSVTPPALGADVFEGIQCASVTLYVPEQSITTYKSTPVWQDFSIQPIKTNGIDDLQVTEANGNGKFIKDGQVVIRHGDRLYNVNGQVVK